ncbi:MAG: PilZ domain-containing protein [Desulfomonile tiedjei]|uniref:PilZ domain-containing protein n=1 Tax=Desulfomonile tiedjei TaxID=2358 RepID=A0A9D6Z586_9BACT|nr:PilZ domain-containing protein [Desulfomonile tiedjei]
MAAKREIRAREIVSDIAAGIGDGELMDKYRLTFRGLQSVFRKLADSNLVDPEVLQARIVPQLNGETSIVIRSPRKDIYMPLTVQDAANPDLLGIVTNITERGLAVKGMSAAIDEVKKLAIKPEKYFQLRSFSLRAKCRWVKPSNGAEETLAGFETIAITQRDLQKLRNLIETLDYMYR